MPPRRGKLVQTRQKTGWRGSQASATLLDLSCSAFIVYTLSLWVLRDGEKVKFIEKKMLVSFRLPPLFTWVSLSQINYYMNLRFYSA